MSKFDAEKAVFKNSITVSGTTYNLGSVDRFTGCTNLTPIDLSNCTALTIIEISAFQGCYNVSSIYIPSSVKAILGAAFCTNINFDSFEILDSKINIHLNWNTNEQIQSLDIDFTDGVPTWPFIVASEEQHKVIFSTKSTFYVPKGLRSTYLSNKKKLCWDSFDGDYTTFIVNDSQVKEIGSAGSVNSTSLAIGLGVGLGVKKHNLKPNKNKSKK